MSDPTHRTRYWKLWKVGMLAFARPLKSPQHVRPSVLNLKKPQSISSHAVINWFEAKTREIALI